MPYFRRPGHICIFQTDQEAPYPLDLTVWAKQDTWLLLLKLKHEYQGRSTKF